LIALVALGTVACTPEEQALFRQLTPAQQSAVLEQMFPPAGCVEAMERVWPQAHWEWARSIMWRESNHIPTARNRSGASGCWQLMLPLHANRFRAVGCDPARWADPLCNNRAAFHLFQEAGRAPWKL